MYVVMYVVMYACCDVCMYVCMYMYMYMCMYVCVCVCAFACLCVHSSIVCVFPLLLFLLVNHDWQFGDYDVACFVDFFSLGCECLCLWVPGPSPVETAVSLLCYPPVLL